jgi:PAS domain S-box-containing protein
MNKPIHENVHIPLKEDVERLHFAMRAAGVGVWELNITTNDVIWDDRCRELFGLSKDNKLPYSEAIKYIHPDDFDAVTTAVQKALSGEDNGHYDIRYRTIGADDGKLRWVHFSGQAYFDENGNPARFGGIAQDITDYTKALLSSEKALQESEGRFRTVISSAPAGIGVFVGSDLIIDMPNQVFIEIVGKGPDIAGRPLREVMPELHNQPFLHILDDVYRTGKTFQSFDTPVNIMQNGEMTTSYFNVTFSPLFDNEGKVYAILDISIDVTENAKARKKLQEAQNILSDAVELAQLATWILDPVSGHVEYSERMKSWLGIDVSGRKVDAGIQSLPEHDREHVKEALSWAMNPKSGGTFDLEYGIINQVTGRERVIHSQGRTLFDDEGKAQKLIGVSQDVTQQRNMRLALEQEVQQRTEELDAANEELRVTNEELQMINDELEKLNDQLEQSNENLQQFAHVASHDLKEPVRKIKTFLGLIEADPENVLSPKTRSLMNRVYAASDRMFSMINGVLTYSTINASGHRTGKVDTAQVVKQILQDLELIIAEKGAIIEHKDLPVIDGAEILIYQLFSNLLINSLKFSRSGVPPFITITAGAARKDNTEFVRITVADNGVGFALHQSEQIFNMFARLHSKDKYEGTGLGLSLCKKIVYRHGGTIEASGIAGEGAVFTIMLPIHQSQNII